MTTAEEFTRQLAARGFHYDRHAEEFRRGDRVPDWEELIALVPGMTLDDLAAGQNAQHDELCQRRAAHPE